MIAATAALSVLLIAIGLAIGLALFRAPITQRLPGDLQEVQTTGGTYLGIIRGEEDGYIRLQDAAIVSVETPSGGTQSQIVVRSLRAEPYGLGSEILISHDQVVFVSGVASDSQLAQAYATALGG